MFCRLMQGRAIWATPGYGEQKAEQLLCVLPLWNFWQETALTWGQELSLKCWKALSLSAFSILQEKPTSPLVPSLQGVHAAAAAASAAPDFPASASPGLPRGGGHGFCSASHQLSQQGSSAPGQSSSWYPVRAFRVVQHEQHRNPSATDSSSVILITPSHCPQTEQHHSTRQARCETQGSKVSL